MKRNFISFLFVFRLAARTYLLLTLPVPVFTFFYLCLAAHIFTVDSEMRLYERLKL